MPGGNSVRDLESWKGKGNRIAGIQIDFDAATRGLPGYADFLKQLRTELPPGKLLPSAHAVDREYKVISALAGTDVPVAKTYALCTDDSVIGTMFYIMDCVDGRIMWDPALPGMTPAQRGAIFDEMNRVIAALHKVDYTAVGLADYGKPSSMAQINWT